MSGKQCNSAWSVLHAYIVERYLRAGIESNQCSGDLSTPTQPSPSRNLLILQQVDAVLRDLQYLSV